MRSDGFFKKIRPLYAAFVLGGVDWKLEVIFGFGGAPRLVFVLLLSLLRFTPSIGT